MPNLNCTIIRSVSGGKMSCDLEDQSNKLDLPDLRMLYVLVTLILFALVKNELSTLFILIRIQTETIYRRWRRPRSYEEVIELRSSFSSV